MTNPPPVSSVDRRPSRVILLACLAFIVWRGVEFAFFGKYHPIGLDYKVFWKAAHAPLAALYETQADNPFVYPPSSLIFFKPLLLLSAPAGFAAWTFVSLSAYLSAVTRAAGVKVALISALSFSAISCLALGQTSLLLGAAIIMAFNLPAFACGALIGIVLAIKPQIIFLAPLAFAIRGDWRALAGMTAAIISLVAVELALFGPQLWVDWIAALPHFNQTVERVGVLTVVITPFGMAEANGLLGLPFWVAGIFVAIAVLIVARNWSGVAFAAAVSAASLMAAPYALRHDMVAIVPACALLLTVRPQWLAFPAVGLLSGSLAGLSLLFAPLIARRTKPNG